MHLYVLVYMSLRKMFVPYGMYVIFFYDENYGVEVTQSFYVDMVISNMV